MKNLSLLKKIVLVSSIGIISVSAGVLLLNDYSKNRIFKLLTNQGVEGTPDQYQILIEKFNSYSLFLPNKIEYQGLLNLYHEFIKFKSQPIQDEKGAFYFLQGLKLKVQVVIENQKKAKSDLLVHEAEALTQLINLYQEKNLKQVINELQNLELRAQTLRKLRHPIEYGSRRVLRVDE